MWIKNIRSFKVAFWLAYNYIKLVLILLRFFFVYFDIIRKSSFNLKYMGKLELDINTINYLGLYASLVDSNQQHKIIKNFLIS